MWLHMGRITTLTHLEKQSFLTKKAAYNKHYIYTKKRGRVAQMGSEHKETRERDSSDGRKS